MPNDTAVSDLIAVVALIAIFVTAAAIVWVALLSSPPGDAAPAMIARSVVGEDSKLYIYHDGGDPLERERFAIRVDGVDRTDDVILINASGIEYAPGTWTTWKTGEALVLDDGMFDAEGPWVQITGEGVGRIGSDWLLHDIGEGTPTPTQTPTPTPTLTPTPTPTLTPTPTPVPLVADFTANVTSGPAPLTVAFTDTSTGGPTSWLWDFGDGNTSTVQNPVHTYESPGNYSVTLTVSNAFGTSTLTKPDYIRVTKSFVNFIIDENVVIYGNALTFKGDSVDGPGATIVITEGLDTSDFNEGASIAVSDIYIDGDVTLNGGSAGLGSPEDPGSIYVNGNLELWVGTRDIYGDVYVAGNFDLKDARIHDDVYVDGDLTLGNTPWIADDARIYYTGTFTHPPTMSQTILDKCIHQATVPGFTMPDQELPTTKPADWYASKGYVSGGELTSNLKVFADSYASTPWRPTATDVVIIARTGDITITGMGGSSVTGVFFAPNGKITFSGAALEGVAIARDGFFVESGGTTVTFRNLEEYIADPADYPF
ncbi:PKD domain-containing protein [Methanoculleus sp. YWC-01]|uniref:PKD domain-containing protein n=1 Tax=Methanoculleus nereidis TaxID=2735141 RepID=A0ABU3Z5K8_9EURY|nr:PKD domain-containing protein [Methanoculleus sp. YWC-01]MDV4344097.1 PKD domain-containing protein [Methanoculleus sp. YWC-01]